MQARRLHHKEQISHLIVTRLLTRPAPITMVELANRKTDDVAVAEVSDYVLGNYRGGFASPPSADLNPKQAIIIRRLLGSFVEPECVSCLCPGNLLL